MISANLHYPLAAEADRQGWLTISAANANRFAIFMPYPVASLMADVFTIMTAGQGREDALEALLCDGMSPNRAAIIHAAIQCERCQTTDDFDGWGDRADELIRLADAEKLASELAEAAFPDTVADRHYEAAE
jgi:hypothetical protein